MSMRISKTKFVACCQCLKRLYLQVHEPGLAAEPEDAVDAVIEQGREVGLLARKLFPGGIEVCSTGLDQAIHTTVTIELTGGESSPGVKEGGVLEQMTREVNIEALPTDIPDSIQHDVSDAQINDTITLAALTVPSGVTLLDDPETVLMTLTPPRLQEEEPEIEEETELVGEGETAEEAEQAAEAGGEAGEGESEEQGGGE